MSEKRRLICIEEHTLSLPIATAIAPAIRAEAPYFLTGAEKFDAFPPPGGARPTFLPFRKTLELGVDLGAGRIGAMDEHGVDVQILSNPAPLQLAPEDRAIALAKTENDRIAEAVANHPGRFAGFAVLPWQDSEASVRELERAIGYLGLKGVMIGGRPGLGNTFLDHARFAPILKRLHELQVPLYVHPYHPAPEVQRVYYEGVSPDVTSGFSTGGWGWHHEAGVQVVRMILAGVFDRYPHLEVISGHWGEMVPFFLARLDDVLPPKVSGLSRTISDTYRANVWVTPSGMFDHPHFEFICKVVGADRIMWSNDYPFLTLDGTRGFLDEAQLDAEDRRKIMHENAERLFGL